MNGWSSSIVSPGLAAPTALELEVSTALDDAGAQRLLHHVARPLDVDLEDPVAGAASHRGGAGDVEDALDALHRLADRLAVGDIADGALELDPLERLRVALLADQQPQFVAAASEFPDHVEADKARPAGDERLRHSAGMVERPNALDRRGRRHDLISDSRSCLPSTTSSSSASTSGSRASRSAKSDIADLHAFYERLRVSDQTVTTSQPSVGDFISVYEPLLDEGKEIVSIHLSSGISGTYESAMQARERLTAEGKGGERIAICDSKTGAGGMGLMILAAAGLLQNAMSAGEDGDHQLLDDFVLSHDDPGDLFAQVLMGLFESAQAGQVGLRGGRHVTVPRYR